MTGAPPIEDIQDLLPPGWTAEPYFHTHPELVVVSAPEIGHVTIDFAARCWRIGVTATGQGRTQRRYRGPGWRMLLAQDALVDLGATP